MFLTAIEDRQNGAVYFVSFGKRYGMTSPEWAAILAAEGNPPASLREVPRAQIEAMEPGKGSYASAKQRETVIWLGIVAAGLLAWYLWKRFRRG